jgi:hypothetical protein
MSIIGSKFEVIVKLPDGAAMVKGKIGQVLVESANTPTYIILSPRASMDSGVSWTKVDEYSLVWGIMVTAAVDIGYVVQFNRETKQEVDKFPFIKVIRRPKPTGGETTVSKKASSTAMDTSKSSNGVAVNTKTKIVGISGSNGKTTRDLRAGDMISVKLKEGTSFSLHISSKTHKQVINSNLHDIMVYAVKVLSKDGNMPLYDNGTQIKWWLFVDSSYNSVLVGSTTASYSSSHLWPVTRIDFVGNASLRGNVTNAARGLRNSTKTTEDVVDIRGGLRKKAAAAKKATAAGRKKSATAKKKTKKAAATEKKKKATAKKKAAATEKKKKAKAKKKAATQKKKKPTKKKNQFNAESRTRKKVFMFGAKSRTYMFGARSRTSKRKKSKRTQLKFKFR